MITFQIYMKIRWHRFGGISPKKISITIILFHVQSIYIYVPLFHVLDKWNAYEKTMEDLHKASVHELNNGVI
jgi:hypothetical protein